MIAPGERFVVQKHSATRLHYDLRLEIDSTLKSWAATKGPSLDPAVKRLAVHVEDHPLSYVDFEGVIPKGEYGGGPVIVWDRGTFAAIGEAAAELALGELKFRLDGTKLKGGFMLVRLKGPRNADGRNWLLIKERDIYARPGSDIATEAPASVLSGHDVGDLAAAAAARTEPAAARLRRPKPAALPGARAATLPEAPRPQLAGTAEESPMKSVTSALRVSIRLGVTPR